MLYHICNIGQRVGEIKGGTVDRSGREVWRVVVKGLGEEGGFLPFGQDAGEPQLSKDKHAADTSLCGEKPPQNGENEGSELGMSSAGTSSAGTGVHKL